MAEAKCLFFPGFNKNTLTSIAVIIFAAITIQNIKSIIIIISLSYQYHYLYYPSCPGTSSQCGHHIKSPVQARRAKKEIGGVGQHVLPIKSTITSYCHYHSQLILSSSKICLGPNKKEKRNRWSIVSTTSLSKL